MVSDSLGHLARDEMLDAAARFGISGIEFNAANWTSALHLNIGEMLSSAGERKNLLTAVKLRGLEISALNANGNQLHPTQGNQQSATLYDTVKLAGALGVKTVVCMSGLPEGIAGDKMPILILHI